MTQSTIPLKKTSSPRNFNDYKVKLSDNQMLQLKSPTRQSKSPSIKDLKIP
jgi:hypothetical protein